jgi:hypothetical protein
MSNRLTAPVLIREEADTGRSTPAAFSGGAMIGALGGLIGLGGAEFRLPLLIGAFRFAALQAVILNKAISLVVVADHRYETQALQYTSQRHIRWGRVLDPERVDDWIDTLSKEAPVITFCVYGFHIGCQTARTHRNAGFDARYMAGGHFAWKALKGLVKCLTKVSRTALSPLGGLPLAIHRCL